MRKTLLLFALLTLTGCSIDAPGNNPKRPDQNRPNPNPPGQDHLNQIRPDAPGRAQRRSGTWVVRSAVFSPDGNKVLVGYMQQDNFQFPNPPNTLLEYTDVVSGKLLWSRPVQGETAPLAILPDGRHGLVWNLGRVQLWSLAEGRYVKDILRDVGRSEIFALTPSGKVCAVLTNDGVATFAVPSGRPLGKVNPPTTPTAIALTPDGDRVLYATNPGLGLPNTVEFWDLANGRLVKSYPRGKGGGPLAISPDGKYAACGLWGKSMD
jgi:WD40 repeat protein